MAHCSRPERERKKQIKTTRENVPNTASHFYVTQFSFFFWGGGNHVGGISEQQEKRAGCLKWIRKSFSGREIKFSKYIHGWRAIGLAAGDPHGPAVVLGVIFWSDAWRKSPAAQLFWCPFKGIGNIFVSLGAKVFLLIKIPRRPTSPKPIMISLSGWLCVALLGPAVPWMGSRHEMLVVSARSSAIQPWKSWKIDEEQPDLVKQHVPEGPVLWSGPGRSFSAIYRTMEMLDGDP